MPLTLAFDVYGTLINTHGVLSKLEQIVGPEAGRFSQTWRDKQLEYSFRRGLMKQYKNFAVCTADALNYTAALYKVRLSDTQIDELLKSYGTLPAFPDVEQGLSRLKDADCRLFAFSNGSAEAVETLLQTANIRDYFKDVVSADEIKTFKPDPAVYQHFLKRADSTATSTWLVSSNPFDVIGATSTGLCSAWVQRTPESIFDPWGIEPTITINSLDQLSQQLPISQ